MRRAGPVRRGAVNHVRRGTEQHSADRRVRHSPPARRVTEFRDQGTGGRGLESGLSFFVWGAYRFIIWRPWALWSEDHFKELFGEDSFDLAFLDADTNDDIALVMMAAGKRQETLSPSDFKYVSFLEVPYVPGSLPKMALPHVF